MLGSIYHSSTCDLPFGWRTSLATIIHHHGCVKGSGVGLLVHGTVDGSNHRAWILVYHHTSL